MAYQKALEENEVQRVNLKSVYAWIDANKSKIKAKSGKTIVYAGIKLPGLNDLSPTDIKTLSAMPVWKYIKSLSSQPAKSEFPGGFQMLGDVLQKLRDHPVFINRDRVKLSFANAFEFFEELNAYPKLLQNAASVQTECWKRLSAAFVTNAKGDLEILDGVADDYQRISKETILLNTELPALLRNSNKLSAEGKAKLLKKISEYGKEFDQRYTKLIRVLDNEVTRLENPRR